MESKKIVQINLFAGQESVQFHSVAQSYLTLCDPVNHSTPGLPVHHQGRSRDTDIQSGHVDMGGKEKVGQTGRSGLTYIHYCVTHISA